MVQAMINISEPVNKILNILKIQRDFKDKSETINFVTEQYAENFMEPELRPEYIEKLKKISAKSKFKTYKSMEAFDEEFGLE
jgi:hypothetical protein